MNAIYLAIAPVMALLTFFYINDRYEKEPMGVLLRLLLGGALAAIPASIAEYFSGIHVPAMEGTWHFWMAFKIAGIEEVCKWAALIFMIHNRPEFNEPYDGLIYGATTALGFAALENIGYVIAFGTGAGVLRAVTAVPLHAMCGAIMGRGLGRARIVSQPPAKVPFGLAGLIVAILLHWAYDLVAMHGGWLGYSLLVLVLILGSFLTFRAMEELQRLSPFRPKN